MAKHRPSLPVTQEYSSKNIIDLGSAGRSVRHPTVSKRADAAGIDPKAELPTTHQDSTVMPEFATVPACNFAEDLSADNAAT